MAKLDDLTFTAIKEKMKPLEGIATTYEAWLKSACQLPKPTFGFKGIALLLEIRQDILQWDTSPNQLALASDFNRLVEVVHLRHSKSIYDLHLIDTRHMIATLDLMSQINALANTTQDYMGHLHNREAYQFPWDDFWQILSGICSTSSPSDFLCLRTHFETQVFSALVQHHPKLDQSVRDQLESVSFDRAPSPIRYGM